MSPVIADVRDRVLPPALRFWRWWIGELLALWPARWHPSPGRSPRAEIRPMRERVEIVRIANCTGERLIEPKPITAFDDEQWGEMAALVAQHRTKVVLTAPLIHVLKLTLPKVARSRLQAAVPLQLRDHSPLRPELIDWAVLAVEPIDDRIRVLVVIVRRSLLDCIADSFREQGHKAPPIIAEADNRTVTLRPGTGLEIASSAIAKPWWIALAIILATPFAALGLLLILCAIERGRVADLEQQARPRLAAERRLRETAAVGHALRQIVDRPTVTAIVEDLASRLPQSAFARQIAADAQGTIRFTLDEADAKAFDAVLARDAVLPELRPVGPPRVTDGRTQVDYVASGR